MDLFQKLKFSTLHSRASDKMLLYYCTGSVRNIDEIAPIFEIMLSNNVFIRAEYPTNHQDQLRGASRTDAGTVSRKGTRCRHQMRLSSSVPDVRILI